MIPPKRSPLINYREKSTAWWNTITLNKGTTYCSIYASKITIVFFLGNKNQSICYTVPIYLVIVCTNLTIASNAVIFKRIADNVSSNRLLQ